MRAAVLHAAGQPLRLEERPIPRPGPGELRLEVKACGVCRTDLHLADGELETRLPRVLGHQIVGRVDELGPDTPGPAVGARVGATWLAGACGACPRCREGRENLCPAATFTGRDRDGGYAQYALARADFVLPLPDGPSDVDLAPLLCAGAIGFRAYRMAGPTRHLGLWGFGAAAHIIIQLARHEGREVYAYTRPGDREAQNLAIELGAAWAGGSDETAPAELDAALVFAPVGALLPAALAATAAGGTVIAAGIHMSDIPAFPYRLLWGERRLQSVAHLTRADARDFLALAGPAGLRARVRPYPLDRTAQALDDLRAGRVTGSAVITP